MKFPDYYDTTWIKVPKSALEDLEKVLHLAGLIMLKGENYRIKEIPEFLKLKPKQD